MLIFVMMSMASLAMAANTAKMKPVMTTERNELHKNINVIKIDPKIKNATPYWIIIAAGNIEKGRAATFKYIDSSTNLTKEEKVELKKFVKELWRKYRVRAIKDGNVTLITLNSKAGINLTHEEEVMLEKVAQSDKISRIGIDSCGLLPPLQKGENLSRLPAYACNYGISFLDCVMG
ncbi:hypothetical protein [Geoglobus acetivorans]|uniref:Uncharacterized protein n=1 Tax=Geoglobus acetivorans TaxID=565033 RepID=A0ABZ3H476_GEOAI|nr:hypothetical protein [Geoglobus acetivorans]